MREYRLIIDVHHRYCVDIEADDLDAAQDVAARWETVDAAAIDVMACRTSTEVTVVQVQELDANGGDDGVQTTRD